MISSIIALGYNDRVGTPSDTPAFVRALRIAVLSRAYAANINHALFHGRPPRLRRRDLAVLTFEDDEDLHCRTASAAGCGDPCSFRDVSSDMSIELAPDTQLGGKVRLRSMLAYLNR